MIPFLLAMFLAIICSPAVAWMTKRRVPVSLAVLAVVIVLLAVFSAFGAIVGGSVNDFGAFANKYQGRFDGLVVEATRWFEKAHQQPDAGAEAELVSTSRRERKGIAPPAAPCL